MSAHAYDPWLVARFEPRIETAEDGLLAHEAFEALLELSSRRATRQGAGQQRQQQQRHFLLLSCQEFVRGVARGGNEFELLLLLLSPKTLC